MRAAQRVATAVRRQEKSQIEILKKSKRNSFFGAGNPKPTSNSNSFRGNHFSSFDDKMKCQLDIKAHEKRSIISQFLHHDVVLSKLCKMMFMGQDEDMLIMDNEMYQPSKLAIDFQDDKITKDNIEIYKQLLDDREIQEQVKHDIIHKYY